jgi:phosphatidylinositol 3-kinase
MDTSKDFYSFVKLTDLPSSLSFSVRIHSLQGNLTRSSLIDLLEDESKKAWGINAEEYPPFYLTLRLYSANKPLTPVQRTPYKPFKKGWVWNTSIDLGYPIRQLPLDAQLGITIWDTQGPVNDDQDSQDGIGVRDRIIGGTTLKLFGKKGTLKKAQHRCYVHLGQMADGSVSSETTSKGPGQTSEEGRDGASEMTRLEKLIKRHERMDIPHVKWLDKQTYRVIEGIHAKESTAIANELWLYVDLPRFEWPIVWCEEEEATTDISRSGGATRGFGAGPSNASSSNTLSTSSGPPAPTTANAAAGASSSLLDRTLFTLPDPESLRENPIEAKHRRLVRAQRSRNRGLGSSCLGAGTAGNLSLARNLKPDKKARDEIEEILSAPPTRDLTDKESDLLWTYRFYLTKNPRALTKFLKAVSWNDRVESRMAVETVLPLWGGTATIDGVTVTASTAAIEIGDVLELLGPGCRMMDKSVRKWAVDRLAERDDAELSLYLLQLVQALKLDDRDEEAEVGRSKTSSAGSGSSSKKSSLVTTAPSIDQANTSTIYLGALTEFLLARALASAKQATLPGQPDEASFSLMITFYWYLSVECSDDRWGVLYRRIRRRLERGLESSGNIGKDYYVILKRQEKMVQKLSEMARALKTSKDARPKKIEKLRELVKDQKSLGMLVQQSSQQQDPEEGLTSLPLPLDPTIRARAIKTEACSVFKSNLFPLLIWFEATSSEAPAIASTPTPPESSEYALIFKSGDDLRQDQLVLQLFALMNRLLLNENLNLHLTPYRVLATSPKEGMVQFVKSQTLASIMTEHGSLNEYLKKSQTPTPMTWDEKLDRFTRSCAGYCVVTYLLGVGDRHLDNLLLTPDGRFFHVDFGYILNRDPKPFPPPVKVSKEMVDCLGGTSSADYSRFRQLCFTAFSILRKNSNLICNLVGLMSDAEVGDIKVEPDRAVAKVLEKFRLDLSDQDARSYFDDLLQQSSYLTVVFDRLHDAAQFFRS